MNVFRKWKAAYCGYNVPAFRTPAPKRGRWTPLVLLTAVLTFAACGTDGVTAPVRPPTQAAAQDLLGGVTGLVGVILRPVTAVTWKSAQSSAVTVSQLVNNRTGAVIQLPNQGLKLNVPKGALPRDTMTITVKVIPGRIVAYDFMPHGTKFSQTLTFSQDLTKTNYLLGTGLLPGLFLRGAYFAQDSQLDQKNGVALVNELFEARLDLLARRVEFPVPHFSGYMVSSF